MGLEKIVILEMDLENDADVYESVVTGTAHRDFSIVKRLSIVFDSVAEFFPYEDDAYAEMRAALAWIYIGGVPHKLPKEFSPYMQNFLEDWDRSQRDIAQYKKIPSDGTRVQAGLESRQLMKMFNILAMDDAIIRSREDAVYGMDKLPKMIRDAKAWKTFLGFTDHPRLDKAHDGRVQVMENRYKTIKTNLRNGPQAPHPDY